MGEVLCICIGRKIPRKSIHLRNDKNNTILEFLFCEEEFMDVLAEKVIQNTQLKLLTDELMALLKRGDDDDIASAFAGKVNDLTNCTDFIEACSENCHTPIGKFRDTSWLPYYVDFYREEGNSAQVKMRDLREDGFLQCILEQKEPLPITKGILSVLIGFWSNDSFHKKLQTAIEIRHHQDRRNECFSREAAKLQTAIEIRHHQNRWNKLNSETIDVDEIPYFADIFHQI